MAERQLNRGSFVLLYFALFAFSELYAYFIYVLSVFFSLSTFLYFPENPSWVQIADVAA